MKESEIIGIGYGYKHLWKQCFTNRTCDPTKKFTVWQCDLCKQTFRHFYDITPYIFDAIKDAGISEDCDRGELKR